MKNQILLNKEQQKAVDTINGPLLIIAGAGSGKTRVITQRIQAMLRKGIQQSAILALTFTNKAAREMSGRVTQDSGRNYRRLTISTFHSFGLEILKKHIELLGWRKNFTVYDSNDQRSLIRDCARDMPVDHESLNYYEIAQTFSLIKSNRREWSDNEIDESLKSLYTEYQSRRILYSALDFDDLIQLPIMLFKKYPSILKEYQDRYCYIMVDEFQDTSVPQYELMKFLADGSRNICVVGDDDQSIYSWRGANFSNIQNFENDYPERMEIKLEQNYRSTGVILDAANHLIKNNKQRKKKHLWTGGSDGTVIEIYQPENERMEAEWIADLIQTVNLREGTRYHNIAVLMRTNNLSRPLEEELLSRNIPYQTSGGTSFFERPEIKDMIAYLRCMSNPDDDVNLLKIVNTPRRGIGKGCIERLVALVQHGGPQSGSLYSAMKNLDSDPEGAMNAHISAQMLADIGTFYALINSYRPRFLGNKPIADTFQELLNEIDYQGYLTHEFRNNEVVSTYRWKNIESFKASMRQWGQRPDNANSTIFDYLNRITLASRDAQDEEGKVNIMTIHSAKGMEFDMVCIAGVEDGIIPHRRSLEDNSSYEDSLEEERRLFYVALTRAKKKLYLTHCQKRLIQQKVNDMEPSPFLEEIPTTLINNSEPETDMDSEEAASYFALMKERFSADSE